MASKATKRRSQVNFILFYLLQEFKERFKHRQEVWLIHRPDPEASFSFWTLSWSENQRGVGVQLSGAFYQLIRKKMKTFCLNKLHFVSDTSLK